MSKINLDKYYTSKELSQYVVNKTKEIIGGNNINEFLEPSAGNGAFLDCLDKPYLAYDIEPENDRIVKQDYLDLTLEYKKGRCIIGNPPYGKANVLAIQFYKKSIQLGDYIAFILPASQYNNNQLMYEFDLIYSELIDNKGFVDLDKRIKLCFNIYKRNPIGLNKKPKYKFKDFNIIEYRRGKNYNQDTSKLNGYDIGICAFGWNIGNEVEYMGQYVREFYIFANNKDKKEKIIKEIKEAKWKEIYCMTGSESINQWQVYKYIKEKIPEIE